MGNDLHRHHSKEDIQIRWQISIWTNAPHFYSIKEVQTKTTLHTYLNGQNLEHLIIPNAGEGVE